MDNAMDHFFYDRKFILNPLTYIFIVNYVLFVNYFAFCPDITMTITGQ